MSIAQQKEIDALKQLVAELEAHVEMLILRLDALEGKAQRSTLSLPWKRKSAETH